MNFADGARNVFKHRAWCSGNILCGYFYLQRALCSDLSLDVSRQKCGLVSGTVADSLSQSQSEHTLWRENIYTQGSKLPSSASLEFLELG